MAFPLPADKARNSESYLKGWKRATATDFLFGEFIRYTAAGRAVIVAEADALFGRPED